MRAFRMRALLQSLRQNLLALVDLVEEGHLDVPLMMNMMHIGVRSHQYTITSNLPFSIWF